MRHMKKNYDVAAYIWPAYTGDEPRSRIFWEEGIGEWQTVRKAKAKFDGHNWPRKPLWGYENEADPKVMKRQIDEATRHGVNVFIYDWYWYDNRPFLENCLNEGFLKAENNEKMKFYLMWANHSACTLWDIRNSHDLETYIWDGAVSRPGFEIVCRRLIEKYFCKPNYYRIDGKPVFMIYDLDNLMKGLGSLEETKAALEWFKEECVKAGLGGLHLMATKWGRENNNLSGVDCGISIKNSETIKALGFDSLTHYQFLHFVDIDRDYCDILHDVKKEWDEIDEEYSQTYFPHISIGWDNNPRFLDFRPGIVKNNTPENVRKGFEMAREYLDKHPDQPPLVTINSWNEWTETSYLQPDDMYGYGYLDAVKKVFGSDDHNVLVDLNYERVIRDGSYKIENAKEYIHNQK
jgi:hypothetical protein